MKNLILLTTNFPFGAKEPFLETEISFLSGKFETIFLIATKPDSSTKREVPKNARVIAFPNEKILFKSLIVFVKHGFSIIKCIACDMSYIIQNADNHFFVRFLELSKHSIKAFLIMDFITKIIPIQPAQYLIYSYWFNSAALSAGLLKKKYPSLTAISRLHRWDLYSENHTSNYLPLQHKKATLLDECFFISDQGKRYFEEKYGLLPSLSLAKLGVMRQTDFPLQPSDAKFHIVSCSYLSRIKRVELIIETLALIDEIDIRWTHIGGGELFEELNTLADDKLALKENISYKFTNNYSKKEVIEFYKENYVHMFINTSLSEGIPVAIMEAMSFSIPVIATDVGGTSEIVNESCGVLLDMNCSQNDIKQEILKLYSNYDAYPYRQNAHNNWANNFNAEVNYSRFIDKIIRDSDTSEK